MSHLLRLSDLHVAAPGVLDVVFGPDGDFAGAPDWTCPCWDGEEYTHTINRGALDAFVFGGRVPLRFALDLRVPSVAARLAGLCARALGLIPGTYALGEHPRGGYTLRRAEPFAGVAPDIAAWDAHGRSVQCYREDEAPLPPTIIVPLSRPMRAPEFLITLTLTLAPKIAALGRTP